MLLFASGIIIGLLIAILEAIYAYKSKSSPTEAIAERVTSLLPRKRGSLLKMHNIPEEWHKDIPKGTEYDGKSIKRTSKL